MLLHSDKQHSSKKRTLVYSEAHPENVGTRTRRPGVNGISLQRETLSVCIKGPSAAKGSAYVLAEGLKKKEAVSSFLGHIHCDSSYSLTDCW